MPLLLKDKFDQLKKPLNFQQRSDILSWVVDKMRSDVINHLEKSGILRKMDPHEEKLLLDEINIIQ